MGRLNYRSGSGIFDFAFDQGYSLDVYYRNMLATSIPETE